MFALTDRAVVRVSGPDAVLLLQGIVTNDLDLLASQPAIHAALLTPQGKILADFFIVRAAEGLLLDVPGVATTDLLKRLALYRLRAKVDIADVSREHTVSVAWDRTPDQPGALVYPDPRLPGMGWRVIGPADRPVQHDDGAYHAHRIAHGVPDGGRDYPYGDAFPHEALLDQLHGVSFTKGCYVGQEIVSRMQHRGTARKRIIRAVSRADSVPLPASGAAITAGESVIGTLGAKSGAAGLALVRLDRAAEAIARSVPIHAGDVEVRLEVQPWASFRL